ncbi:MAG TPA: sporulation protein YabP [Clostridiales bacterium]|nr:sporulation protein YabP [Clostridiales bacterium]
MGYDNERPAPHHVVLEERGSLSISGVNDVESFDDRSVTMTTVAGTMVVSGEGLHIEKFSMDGGDLRVEGKINAITYEDDRPGESAGFFSRLFR